MNGRAQSTWLLPEPVAGRGRFGFATLGTPGAALRDVIATAQRHGVAALELRAAEGEPAHRGLSASQAARIRDDIEAAGLTVLALDTYVQLCAPGPSPGASDPQLDDLLAHIDLARRTGALAVRVFMKDESTPGPPGSSTPSDGEAQALRRLRDVAAQAADAGVRVLAETHDSHSRASSMAGFFAQLDAEVPGHGCGVVWDTGHTFTHGERPAESLALLRPWLGYLQIKDVRTASDATPVPLGSGSYPVDALATALEAADFTGWVSLEWERRWHPRLPPIDEALRTARDWAAPLLRPAHPTGRTDSTEVPPA